MLAREMVGLDARAALASPYMDEAYVERVVSMSDIVARNYAITLGYHDLAVASAAVLGQENSNWLCFGQWASAEAGRAIRRESVPTMARPLLGRRVSEAVAAGNAAVFGDIAPSFIRFIREFIDSADGGPVPSPDRAIEGLARLHAHPQLQASPDLRGAFAAYTEALVLRDEVSDEARRRRAQRMLAGNGFIGAHEQTIADPFVKVAVPGRSIIAIAATAHLGIRVPQGILELEEDVPAPMYLAGPPFPEALLELTDIDAVELAIRFGQDLVSAIDSDAPNWEDYRERMGYIFTFLRAFQQDPEMFDLPPIVIVDVLTVEGSTIEPGPGRSG
jgi:hypothetical protein